MNETFNILKNVRDFAPGAFENTAVEDGSIQLGHIGKGYLPNGSYTAPAHTSAPFTRLVPSWNVDTPPGTWVEVQVRVFCAGQWSRWFSFGKWSPYIDRASPEPFEDEIAHCDAEFLSISDSVNERVILRGSDTYQIRIFLSTEDPAFTPMVHLLAISVELADPPPAAATRFSRVLEVPAYSCLVRDPAIDERMAGACAVTMMLNRWGEDLLPEEVAREVYDSGAGRYANLAFLSAVCGMYGFECYGGFGQIDALRREVWKGHAVAAKVRYRAPALGEKEGEDPPGRTEKTAGLPVWEHATVDSLGHLVVVRGFVWRGEQECVVVNDPLAPTNSEVFREIPIERFLEIYLGIYLMLHNKNGAGLAKPRRMLAWLHLENNALRLEYRGKTLLPGHAAQSTICYTLTDADSTAYPTAAQKKFYYLQPGPGGALRFDSAAALDKKITFYFIGPLGNTYVAEKRLREAPAAETPDGDEKNTP